MLPTVFRSSRTHLEFADVLLLTKGTYNNVSPDRWPTSASPFGVVKRKKGRWIPQAPAPVLSGRGGSSEQTVGLLGALTVQRSTSSPGEPNIPPVRCLGDFPNDPNASNTIHKSREMVIQRFGVDAVPLQRQQFAATHPGGDEQTNQVGEFGINRFDVVDDVTDLVNFAAATSASDRVPFTVLVTRRRLPVMASGDTSASTRRKPSRTFSTPPHPRFRREAEDPSTSFRRGASCGFSGSLRTA